MTSRPIQIMSAMVGEVIADKYFLAKILGAGGNGTVFEARHVDDGRRFALKLIRVENPNTIARFKLEVEAVSSMMVRGAPIPVQTVLSVDSAAANLISTTLQTPEDCPRRIQREQR